MFYFLEEFDIVNFAEDSTPHNADENIEFVVKIQKIHDQFFLNGSTKTT